MEVTDANKREIDKVIHQIVGVKYKDCPATWKEVKKRIAENEESFVFELKQKWSIHSCIERTLCRPNRIYPETGTE